MTQASSIITSLTSNAIPGASGLATGLATGSAAWAFAVAVACALPACAVQARLAFRDFLHYRIMTRPHIESPANRTAARKFRKECDAPP
jgi:hypothetical protein